MLNAQMHTLGNRRFSGLVTLLSTLWLSLLANNRPRKQIHNFFFLLLTLTIPAGAIATLD